MKNFKNVLVKFSIFAADKISVYCMYTAWATFRNSECRIDHILLSNSMTTYIVEFINFYAFATQILGCNSKEMVSEISMQFVV